MNSVNCFKDLFESIPEYKKIVLIMFLNKNDVNFLNECGFLKGDITFLHKEFKIILLELNEEYLDHIKKQEESILETFLNKKMEQNFNTIFEDIRHERSLILLLALVEPDILKQSNSADHEIDIIKNIALEKLHRQRHLREIIALDLLEKQFSDQKKDNIFIPI